MSFSREDTKAIKGFAIILMLLHHLWAFPDRIAGGELQSLIHISGINASYFMGVFGKICVSLFFFLGGFGIYMQSKKKDFSVINCIKKLYLSYWKIFILFIPVAYIFFARQWAYCDDVNIWNRYGQFDISVLLRDFLGITSDLNSEWWFLGSYVVAIVLFPLFKRLFKNASIYKSFAIVIIVGLATAYIFPAIGEISELGHLNTSFLYRTVFCQPGEYYACFLVGMLFAQHDLFAKIDQILQKYFKRTIPLCLFVLVAIIFLRYNTTGSSLDIIYAPAVTICVAKIASKLKVISRMLQSLGKHSTTMWLTHSFYCYYFYQTARIITFTHWAVPSLIIFIAGTFIGAVIIDGAWSHVSQFVQKLQNNRHKNALL